MSTVVFLTIILGVRLWMYFLTTLYISHIFLLGNKFTSMTKSLALQCLYLLNHIILISPMWKLSTARWNNSCPRLVSCTLNIKAYFLLYKNTADSAEEIHITKLHVLCKKLFRSLFSNFFIDVCRNLIWCRRGNQITCTSAGISHTSSLRCIEGFI